MGFHRALPNVVDQEGKAHYFKEDDFSVIKADPRMMIVRIHTQFVHCILIAGHAPHRGQSYQTIERFWLDITEAIPTKYHSWPRLLLVDANTEVGLEPSDHIGTWQAGKQCEKATPFIEFLEREGLFLPATFQHLHEGDGATWQHANGSWSRLDFVGLSLAWPLTSCVSQVMPQIDVSLERIDHLATGTRFCFEAQGRTASGHRPPRMKPDMEQHCQLVTRALQRAFGRAPRQPKALKPSLTGPTWELIQSKRKCRAAMAEANYIQLRSRLLLFVV